MTLNTAMSRGWTAAAAAAILATVAALAFLGIASATSLSNLTVGSATVAPAETVTIDVTTTADGLATYRVDVQYDSTLVTATECTSSNGVCSIDVVASDTVRINGSKLGTGITGTDVVLGTITFLAGSSEGVAALTVDPTTQVFADNTDETAALTVTATNGAITIAVPAATASPTVAPVAVPATGGTPGTSSASSMTWLLAATGLAIVAGGAWVLARAGREN